MLDRASLRKLAETPERNDPALNVALAEEGPFDLLRSLASCPALASEALAVIAARIDGQGLAIESDPEARDEAPDLAELTLALVRHPRTADEVRDALLLRHEGEPELLLAAASHARATTRALDGAALWPSTSALHDRPWLALLAGGAVPFDVVDRWASGEELMREAAARLTRDARTLAALAGDPSRRVRRAVASNPNAGAVREALTRDQAAEVRARAHLDIGSAKVAEGAVTTDAALAAMESGGVLALDVARALLNAGSELDEEGALLAARHFTSDQLLTLVGMVTTGDVDALSPRGVGVGAGLSLRPSTSTGIQGEDAGEGTGSITTHIVHLVTRAPSQSTRLTGKARFASWMADSLMQSRVIDARALGFEALAGTLASDRMVLLRSLGKQRGAIGCLSDAAVPHALVELSWSDPSVSDEDAIGLSSRVVPAPQRGKDLPEDDLDLAPGCRPLAVLERAVLAAITRRTPVSPRAALAVIALEPRRVRYVLSALPTWRGTLTGARLMRVLSAHAGALSAAAPTGSGPHAANVARWTDRALSEADACVAIAVGDLTITELLLRFAKGSVKLQDGVMLAAGVEARAAVDGAATFVKLLEYAASRRTVDATALALWLLLEALDRPRASSLIASAVDGLSGAGSVVAPGVCEALATLERRSPGRLETIFTQSPRGRATVASAIARAYRAVGGLRDD